jgi:lipopolysaccharide exporter
MNLKNRAVTGVKWTSLATAITLSLQFLQLVITARLLTPRDFGLMGAAMLVIGLGHTFADMGVSAAIIYRQEIGKAQLSSLYWLNIMAGVLIFIIVSITSWLIALLFSEPDLNSILICCASVFVLSAIGTQFQLLFQKELQFGLLAVQEVAGTAIGVIVCVVLAFLGAGVWSLVWGSVVTAFAKSVLVAVPGFRQWRPTAHFDWEDLRGYLSFGLYQMGERAVNYFNLRIDQMVIGTTLGTQALGYYNFAFGLVLRPQLRINPIVTKVAFPVFARLQSDESRLRAGYLKVTRILTSANAPILLGMSVVAPLAVPLVFGPQWHDAIPLVQVLCIFALIRSTGNPIGSLLLAKGRADLGFHWNLILLIVIAPVVFIAARIGGLQGIAWALTGCQGILAIFSYYYLVVPLIGKCGREYIQAIVRPGFLAVLTAIGVLIMAPVLAPLKPALGLGIEIALGALAYCILAWAFERDTLKELMIKKRSA